jgi:hypothetical protein
MALYIATHKAPDPRFTKRFTYILSSKFQPDSVSAGLYLTDNDSLINISKKNDSYSELTCMFALYQLLKEGRLSDPFIGLFHYRRYLTEYKKYSTLVKRFNRKLRHQFKAQPYFILNESRASALLSTEYHIIVPKPNQFKFTVYEHYSIFHHIEDLDFALETVRITDPSYEAAIMQLCNQTYLYSYNLFVMPRNLFCEYAEWLFVLLERIESKISTDGRDNYQKRVPAFLAERLFNLWLIRHANRVRLIQMDVLLFEGAS